jgi:aerobic-type carbon monoxide dehydrogenase small subunit (CoxS/CutS family)
MNRNDLFDEPEGKKPEEPAAATPEREQPERQTGGDKGGGGSRFSRRDVLRGAGAAAVAGAVVGAGAAYGLKGGGTSEPAAGENAISVGAPGGKLISEAVVRLNVNGSDRWVTVKTHETLAEVLRRTLGLTGTNIGCDRSECSACSVIVDGVAMNSCSLLAIREEGKKITTIEGLSENGQPSFVQQAFLDSMGLQCGFCTPGQVMQTTALLQHTPKPTEADVRRALSGNLCKCAAYPNILTAVMKAAGKSAG